MINNLKSVGKKLGTEFNFSQNALYLNTLPLHHILNLAGKEEFKDELKERFLKAYFEDNVCLNDIEVLANMLKDFGWGKYKVKNIIDDSTILRFYDSTILSKVKMQIALYQQRGVTGVPFFVINDKYGISGAQPKETFLKVFDSVLPIEEMKKEMNAPYKLENAKSIMLVIPN